MKITVVAMGKIGLPLAVQFAKMGHEVIGADVNQNTVDLVNQGIEPFPGEAHLAELMNDLVPKGRLRATTSTTEAVSESDAVVVVVPLFVDAEGTPDFDWMDAATRDIGAGLKPGTLVSYETTLPVGTTRNRFGPMLESISGLKAGKDFHLVFSPERVFTGRVFEDLKKYPKLVGGVNPESAEAGVAFYKQVLEFDVRDDLPKENGVWNIGTSEASELAKLAETTYRDVNIGLANQFAMFAASNGIDIYSVIEACNSQPFSHIHQPGIAVGGHCIPIYPRMYLWNDPSATVVRAAREANVAMPSYAVSLLESSEGTLEGLKVAVLGASYRGGVKETAFSGIFPVVEALNAAGAHVYVNDPMYSDKEIQSFGWNVYHLGQETDAVVLQANHSEYKNLKLSDFPGLRAIVDGRNFLDSKNFKGVNFFALGSAQI
jgi:nucleotide sugar dehydrogenase